MRLVEAIVGFSSLDEDAEHTHFLLEDGTKITEFDGCDHKDNPTKILVKLTKKLKENDELIEIADGSDTLWYGIIRHG